MTEEEEKIPTDSPEMVTLGMLASETGLNPTNMRRTLIRVGLLPVQVRVGGRKQYAVSRTDGDEFKAMYTNPGVVVAKKALIPDGFGGVYLVLPDPEHRPKRLKIGWADSFRDRLNTHRCIAPELEVVRLYPTRARWAENMAILVLERLGRAVSGEIFDLEDVDGAVALLDRQFENIQVARIAERELT